MYNGEEAVFESLTRPDTVDVVPITTDGKIVIIYEEQPVKDVFMSFPGGRVEPDEDVVKAGLRELREETGYEAKSVEPWFAIQPVSKIDWAIYFLLARGCVKVGDQNLDAGEKIRVEEIEFEKFIELAGEGKFSKDICVKVLETKLDPVKMAQLKKLFGQK